METVIDHTNIETSLWIERCSMGHQVKNMSPVLLFYVASHNKPRNGLVLS